MTDSTMLHRAMLDLIHDVVLVVRDNAIVEASRSAEAHLGYSREELRAVDPNALIATTSVDLDQLVTSPLSMVQMLRKDGSLCRCELRVNATSDGQLVLVATPTNAAEVDPLTRLGNRVQLEQRLDELGQSPHAMVGCFFIDLDHFKPINDQWGHLAGDEVLRVVATRIRHCFRPHDVVVRYGGDEFVALVSRCDNEQAEAIGRRILHSLTSAVEYSGEKIPLTASIGIACGSPSLALVESADRAMYEAKAAGRKTLQLTRR